MLRPGRRLFPLIQFFDFTLFLGNVKGLVVIFSGFAGDLDAVGVILTRYELRIEHKIISEEEDVSPAKLLTLFSGTNVSFRLGIRYNLVGNFSLKLAYRLHITRIGSWDPLLSVSDNFITCVTHKF